MDQTIKDSVAWLKDLAHPGAHLRLDSREVKPGDIFCAVPVSYTHLTLPTILRV